jgi:hypothetical protein
VLWELLTEKIPFQGKEAFQVALSVARNNERPPLPPNLPDGLRVLLEQCWDRVPENRPTFGQICTKFAAKLVFYPNGSTNIMDAFFHKFPLSEDEVRDMTAAGPTAAPAFEELLPTPEDFNIEAIMVRPGEPSPIDVHNEPLGGQKEAAPQANPFLPAAATPPSAETPPEAESAPAMPPPMAVPHGPAMPPPMAAPRVLAPPRPGAVPGAAPRQLQRSSSPPGEKGGAPRKKAIAPLSVRPVQRNFPGFVPPPHSVAPTKLDSNIFLKGGTYQRAPKSVFNAKANGTTLNSDNLFLEKVDAGPARTTARRSTFEAFFMSKLTELTVDTAQEFFGSLADQMDSALSPSQRSNILNQLSLFLVPNITFLPGFIDSNLLHKIDFKASDCFEANARILIACFQVKPAAVAFEYLREMGCQATKRDCALYLLKFLSLFLPRAEEHPDAAAIVELFLTGYKCYMITEKFIGMVFFILKSPLFARFEETCIHILCDGAVGTDKAIAKACMAAFCQIEITNKTIPIKEFVESLAKGILPQETIEVLCRLTAFPSSNRMVVALLTVGSQSPLTVVGLTRMAADPKGAELILQNRFWMNPAIGTLSIADAFHVFLAISQHPALRTSITELEETPGFLTWIAQQAEPQALEALVIIVRRVRLSSEFIIALDGFGFFPEFFRRSLESGFPTVQDSAVLLVDKFARVVWVDGFAHFIAYLPPMLVSEQLGQKALIAAVVLAVHPEAKHYFIAVQLESALRQMVIDPSLEQYRASLLDCILAEVDNAGGE